VEVVSAFAVIGTSQVLGVDNERAIEAFVCQLYEPGTATVHVGDLRWKLFSKKQLEAKSHLQHEEPYMKPSSEHITRL